VIEHFGYIWVQQREVYMAHPSFSQEKFCFYQPVLTVSIAHRYIVAYVLTLYLHVDEKESHIKNKQIISIMLHISKHNLNKHLNLLRTNLVSKTVTRCHTTAVRNTSFMKQQFVVTHTIRQSKIVAFLHSWITNTPSIKTVSIKNCFSFYFRKKICA
jgi:hypothetical protein